MQIFEYTPPAIPWLDLRYVDQDIIVINKPSGLLSNPGRAAHTHDCALTRLQHLYPEAILLHRLDCDTSGLMVFARDKACESHIKTQFQDRKTRKIYVAEVMGHLSEPAGQINLSMTADKANPPWQVIAADGKVAITDWQVLAERSQTSLVQLTPHTGRTHQLRLHMQAIGHTILGDNFYGDTQCRQASPRLRLHAWQLGFTHPKTNEWLMFTSPQPF
ncbi:RluA family pseudouridine synthase [Shewanella sp. NIFS-20-20]|uniref:RluA family pseudouridine synthase n=1 Tax=Shewanella sp. NIFS-20-20 TaxID=2853806 RepID=UPI001C483F8D|nr:RluA family pseudouridine synthase [Shewanella sp. NIFS-20-20]MBV7314980.1 RluA family pseudouridine synthase [Shewanella sp. NIFS-20-20]